MLQFNNATPFVGTIFLLPDPEAIDTLFTVVKGTFAVSDGSVVLADDQVPVALEDKYHGELGSSSVMVPSDVGLTKPGTDVLLIGHAHTLDGRSSTQVDVSLSIGDLRKVVRVFGDRVWHSGAAGGEISPAKPFTRMPLVWERAYGGVDRTNKGKSEDPRNPVGTGYRTADSEQPLHGLSLPNLEDPEAMISGWRDRPDPVCFAPVAAHWEPRRSYAGTYDEQWRNGRAPFLPLDFDPRFSQLAPPGLVSPRYLRGGEPVEVRGVTVSGLLRFQLPPVQVRATYVMDGAPHVRPANLDTVLIEPDEKRLVLLWRAALPCDKRALRVSQVRAELTKAA